MSICALFASLLQLALLSEISLHVDAFREFSKIKQISDRIDIDRIIDLIMMGLIGFGVVSVFINIMGMFHYCVDHIVFQIIYGVILAPTMVFVIVCGGISIATGVHSRETIQSACDEVYEKFKVEVDVGTQIE